MLESCADQGESLRRWIPKAAWSVIAMVSQGDVSTELPLLWQVCGALQELQYRVTVLDATTQESEDNPGLQNLLDSAHWLEDAPAPVMPLHIVPARRGLSRLAQLASQDHPMPLQPLGHLFRNCDVVVLYGSAHLLTSLLINSEVRPLLAVTSLRESVLEAYKNIKNLLLQARQLPIIVPVITSPIQRAENLARTTGRVLQKCARIYLGCNTEFMTVRSFQQHKPVWDDARSLVLRLMANAAPVVQGASTATHHKTWVSGISVMGAR
ncbi:MAG: hypothetical protein NTZ15_00685 [Burkholderiales bacterium]|nr:hypothetical protein [Burkholderiales bacterium]